MGPPPALMRFNLPSEKKAISRPSGDQNPPRASSVPGSRRISRLSSERTAIESLPPSSWRRNRMRRASGESAMIPKMTWPEGGWIVKRVSSAGACGRRERSTAPAPMTTASAAIAQANTSRRLRPPARTGGIAPDEPSAIHFSSLATSPAFCQRSSGSLARHVFTMRSRAGGDMG